jgi:hypothetical protein
VRNGSLAGSAPRILLLVRTVGWLVCSSRTTPEKLPNSTAVFHLPPLIEKILPDDRLARS